MPLSKTDAVLPDDAVSVNGQHCRPGALGSLRKVIGSLLSRSPTRVLTAGSGEHGAALDAVPARGRPVRVDHQVGDRGRRQHGLVPARRQIDRALRPPQTLRQTRVDRGQIDVGEVAGRCPVPRRTLVVAATSRSPRAARSAGHGAAAPRSRSRSTWCRRSARRSRTAGGRPRGPRRTPRRVPAASVANTSMEVASGGADQSGQDGACAGRSAASRPRRARRRGPRPRPRRRSRPTPPGPGCCCASTPVAMPSLPFTIAMTVTSREQRNPVGGQRVRGPAQVGSAGLLGDDHGGVGLGQLQGGLDRSQVRCGAL